MDEMRRRDREGGREFALGVIDEAPYGVLGLRDRDGSPYTVVLSMVRLGDRLYFHSAKGGKKVGLMHDGDVVSASFVSYCRVPGFYSHEEVRAMLGGSGGDVSKVFTTEFSSAHVRGRVYLVEDEAEKARALVALCEKYTPGLADLAPVAATQSLGFTAVYRIEMDEVRGKAKEYDAEGKEVKRFGR